MDLVSLAELTIESQKYSSVKSLLHRGLLLIWYSHSLMNLLLHRWDIQQKELLSFCSNAHFSNLAVSLSPLHFSSCLSEVRGLDQDTVTQHHPITGTRITAFHLICITSCLAARKHAWLLVTHQAINFCLGDSSSSLFTTLPISSLALLSQVTSVYRWTETDEVWGKDSLSTHSKELEEL